MVNCWLRMVGGWLSPINDRSLITNRWWKYIMPINECRSMKIHCWLLAKAGWLMTTGGKLMKSMMVNGQVIVKYLVRVAVGISKQQLMDFSAVWMERKSADLCSDVHWQKTGWALRWADGCEPKWPSRSHQKYVRWFVINDAFAMAICFCVLACYRFSADMVHIEQRTQPAMCST